MRTVQRTRRILLAATFLTTVLTGMTQAAEQPNTAAAQPATTVVAKPSSPVSTRTGRPKPAPNTFRHQSKPVRLASRLNEPARECYFWPFCSGHFLLILGVGY
jgi:hypothetical protein